MKTINYNDASSKKWDALAARQTADGFEVLLAGEKKKDGKYAVWELDSEGEITNKLSGKSWISENAVIRSELDHLFGLDFKNTDSFLFG